MLPKQSHPLLHQDTDSTVGQSTLTSSDVRVQLSGNVWYRNLLKPFSRRTVSYKESFRRRVIHSVGIPVSELRGLHEVFKPEYRRFSPLQGMLFSYNNFVNNLFRFGDDSDPAVKLVQMLFHVLPGGEIQPSHLGGNAGAHLTAAIVGDIIVAFEEMRTAQSNEEFEKTLKDTLSKLISDHTDYIKGRNNLLEDLKKAEDALLELQEQEANAEPIRNQIKTLEGDEIKRSRHKIKRLQKDLTKASGNLDELSRIERDISKEEENIEAAEIEISALRKHIVTSLDFKIARKAIRRAQDAIDQEVKSLTELAAVLAQSFCKYDIDGIDITILPKYSTLAILSSFLWRKYDSIQHLKGYFEAIERLGALNCPVSELEALAEDKHGINDSQSCGVSVGSSRNSDDMGLVKLPKIRNWSAHDVAAAAMVTTGKPGSMNRPDIVPFSYVTWAAYSEFPDCGETAIRNLINQMVYNPFTQMFDYEMLLELKAKYYPKMHQLLIDFYRNHHNPQEVTEQNVALDWIEVVSYLNKLRGRDSGVRVRYRREKEQKNIASPLRNLLRVFNALFGVDDLDENILPQLVQQINDLREFGLHVDLSGVKKDGFGILSLADGKVRYELQSYKPVHFGFVQAETIHSDSAGEADFKIFQQLLRYSNTPPSASPQDPAYFEQLALASLFVPYQMQKNTLGRFFRHAPSHYVLLFADLNGSNEKEAALTWLERHFRNKSGGLHEYDRRIRNYQVPTFAPKPPRAEQSLISTVYVN